jgi:hypothetical protein
VNLCDVSKTGWKRGPDISDTLEKRSDGGPAATGGRSSTNREDANLEAPHLVNMEGQLVDLLDLVLGSTSRRNILYLDYG